MSAKAGSTTSPKNNGVHGGMEGGDLLCTSLQVERSTRILQPHTNQDQTIMNTPQLHGTWNSSPPTKSLKSTSNKSSTLPKVIKDLPQIDKT